MEWWGGPEAWSPQASSSLGSSTCADKCSHIDHTTAESHKNGTVLT